MRALAVLLLAPALAAGFALLSERVVPPDAAAPPFKARSVVWGDRVFTERRDLARWLRNRGARYRLWAKRHPRAATRFRRIAALERRDASLAPPGAPSSRRRRS